MLTNANVMDAQQLMTAIIAKPYRIGAKVVKRQVSRAHARQTPIKGVFEQYKKGVFRVHKKGDFSDILERR